MLTLARRLAWVSIAVLFVVFLCHRWFGPDIWYHLYLGSRIIETGSPQPVDGLILQQPGYVNTYWLFQLAVRGLFALGGIPAVALFFLALWSIVLAAWLDGSGLLRAGVWAPVGALAAVLMCQTRFEERPEVVSYVLLALQIRWLCRGRLEDGFSAGWIGFLAAEAVWANVHGYFFLGPCLVGARLLAALLQPGASRARARLSLLLGLTLLASLASPFGLGNWEEVARLGRFFRAMHGSIQEFLPPAKVPAFVWGIKVFEVTWWAVLAGAVAVALRAGRREAFALVLAAAGLALSMTAFRNIPLLIIFSSPLLAAHGDSLRRQGESLRRHRPAALAVLGVVVAVGAVLTAQVVSGRFYRSSGGVPGFGLGESRYGYPVRFSGYLREHGFSGSIFDSPSDGGYLEYHFPELRLYADSRFVDLAPIREYFFALAGPTTLSALDQRWHFDAVLLRTIESPYVIGAWLRRPGWSLAYADLHRAFLVDRRTPAGARAVLQLPHFYQGEDLSVPVDGLAATAWAGILVLSGDRARLRLALRQFGAAPAVPAGLVRFGQEYGQGHSDAEILSLAESLRPKIIPGSP